MNPYFICLAAKAIIGLYRRVGEQYQESYGVHQRFSGGSFVEWSEVTARGRIDYEML
jgi:hypothetical protein